jgi:hypothetical protein
LLLNMEKRYDRRSRSGKSVCPKVCMWSTTDPRLRQVDIHMADESLLYACHVIEIPRIMVIVTVSLGMSKLNDRII